MQPCTALNTLHTVTVSCMLLCKHAARVSAVRLCTLWHHSISKLSHTRTGYHNAIAPSFCLSTAVSDSGLVCCAASLIVHSLAPQHQHVVSHQSEPLPHSGTFFTVFRSVLDTGCICCAASDAFQPRQDCVCISRAACERHCNGGGGVPCHAPPVRQGAGLHLCQPHSRGP